MESSRFRGRLPSSIACRLLAALLLAGSPLVQAHARPAAEFTLAELVEVALRDSPALAAPRAEELAARAGITTARAYPNPELLFDASNASARLAGAPAGSGGNFAISQRLEMPALREARLKTATASAGVARESVRVAENELAAEVKLRFFRVLRAQERLAAATEDLSLAEQIRDRVALRVSVGEAPRFDLIRAETETASAQTALAQERANLARDRALLRALVSPALDPDYRLSADFYRQPPSADRMLLRRSLEETNPLLREADADLSRAREQLELERRSVMPGVDLFIAQERTVDLNTTRAGIVLRVPLLDRRAGPIEQAQRQVQRSAGVLEQRRFELQQHFEAAWQRYEASRATVAALENGILRQARSALEVAEAAYRFGERGIIEYLDAQRQFRQLRNELIDSRFDAFAAEAELERLAAHTLPGE